MGQSINGIDIDTTPTKQQYAGEFFGYKRGWADLKGLFHEPASGGNASTREQFRTGVYAKGFNASDTLDGAFHLEHQEVHGGNKYLHIHGMIAENAVASGNNLIIDVTIAYFRLFATGRTMTVTAPITKQIVVTPAELNAAAGNKRLLGGDILIAQSGGGTGLFNSSDSNTWIADDEIHVSMVVSQMPTSITGGLSSKINISQADIHREVLSGGSPNRILTNGSFWL